METDALSCFICLSVQTTYELATLVMAISGQTVKDFMEEHLLLEIELESARICVECKDRVYSLEEALFYAQELKDRLLKDFDKANYKDNASLDSLIVVDEDPSSEEAELQDGSDGDSMVDIGGDDGADADADAAIVKEECSEEDEYDVRFDESTEKDIITLSTSKFKDEKLSQFICHTCGEQYKALGSLRRHILSKHINGRVECSICEKTFCEKGALHRHMRIHTGEKKYKVIYQLGNTNSQRF